jgi:hypothetical protein
VSDNGWTTNEHGVRWLKHFIKHTEGRVVGARRLLILDGHESHKSSDFKDLCKEHNIYTLCMPPHSSHHLQPLDVGCFSLLKRAYSHVIESLIRNHINHITKLEFLLAFRAAFYRAFTETNIRASFQGAGLVPFNPDAVLSRLDVVVRTPSPALPEPTWVSQTPSNARELEAQSSLVREGFQRHQNSSPESIIEALDRLTKGAERIVHLAVVQQGQISALQKANTIATQRKARKRKRIQKEGDLTVEAGVELNAQREATAQLESERSQNAAQSGGSRQATTRCSRCREPGHNSRTSKKDTVDTTEH